MNKQKLESQRWYDNDNVIICLESQSGSNSYERQKEGDWPRMISRVGYIAGVLFFLLVKALSLSTFFVSLLHHRIFSLSFFSISVSSLSIPLTSKQGIIA